MELVERGVTECNPIGKSGDSGFSTGETGKMSFLQSFFFRGLERIGRKRDNNHIEQPT